MKIFKRIAATAVFVMAIAPVHAKPQILPPVEIEGYKFFDSKTGRSIAFKGINYYPRPNTGELNKNNIDFFTDEFKNIWERDIPILQELGVNAIRVYAVDPSKNHDSFMCALQEAGIYLIVGMAANCFGCAITGDVAPGCYPPALKTRGQEIISAFARYDNVLAFSAGNEVDLVVSPGQPEINGPCQKKFIRDMRKYILECPGIRHIPVGVVVSDAYREATALYYNCQGDDDPLEHAEWFGINAYQHCAGSVTDSAKSNGWQTMKNDFQSYNYSIPVLLTEYGCIRTSFPTIDGFEGQRTFAQAQWLFESGFRDVFEGGFVFEYSTEKDNAATAYPFTSFGSGNYGVGYFSPTDCNDIGRACTYKPKPEFFNLQSAYNDVETTGIIQRESFVPGQHRVGRSKCPTKFPKLSNYSWPSDILGDTRDDLSCTEQVSFTCGVRTPTKSPKPTPSPIPTPAPIVCGCPSCTETILNREATNQDGTYSCRDRIEWLTLFQEGPPLSEYNACVLVSKDEFPLICGPECDPTICLSGGSTKPTNVPTTMSPTKIPTSQPTSSPTLQPTKDPNLPPTEVSPAPPCGCISCTKNILNHVYADASGKHSCGARIEWLQSELGGKLSEHDACVLVSHIESPTGTCGPHCDPINCESMTEPINCGCKSCTKGVWDTLVGPDGNGGVHTCGARIEWLVSEPGGSLKENEACTLVSEQFEGECGPSCDPSNCVE
eukprot:scaffold232727_cov68-Attheya_sp.AAC.1